MSELTNNQLQLLHQLNLVRIALTKEFKNKTYPSTHEFFKHLLKLEILLMENKNKEPLSLLLKENHSSLAVLIDQLLVR